MPKFVQIKDCLSQLGRITSVSVELKWPRHETDDKSHWHYDRVVSGGGLLLDVGCHMLDLVVSSLRSILTTLV